MIRLDGVCKDYHVERGTRRVLDGISFTIEPGETMAVIGANGAGKSTLMKLVGRVETPTAGTLSNSLTTSWPLALGGGFQGSLTGYDNVRFIARVYGRPAEQVLAYVEDFSELGAQLGDPVKTYSSGMRARLMFGLSLAIDFQCYLIDEVVLVGDRRFRDRCEERLFGKLGSRTFLVASHDEGFLEAHCTKALVLHKGRGRVFADVRRALSLYQSLAA